MPTRFWVKNIGKPSSINITIAIIKNNGEKKIRKINAKSLENILVLGFNIFFMLNFDHIEVHVRNSKLYAEFLIKLFDGGRIKKISNNNTYMFVSNDQIHIEIKENVYYQKEFETYDGIGFCLPCLRMKGARQHLSKLKEITITKVIENPDGECIFFKDFENIEWHIKDYNWLDIYVNI